MRRLRLRVAGAPASGMTKDRELIQEIVERAPAVAKPEKIIFGSAATGKMTPDSDIDLLVIEPEPTDTLSLWEVCV